MSNVYIILQCVIWKGEHQNPSLTIQPPQESVAG